MAEEMRISKPTTKKFNEERPVLSSEKMKANDSTFWRYKVYADIRGGSLGRGRQTTVGLSRTAIFSGFAGCVIGNFRDEAGYAVLVGFSQIPECKTLNDPEWLFCVKLCFRAVCLASDRATFENNCMKTNKDGPTLSATQIFGRDYSFRR